MAEHLYVRQAHLVWYLIQHLANFTQNFYGIGFEFCTSALKHGTIFFIHDLDAKAFSGNVKKNLFLELCSLASASIAFSKLAFNILRLVQFVASFQYAKLLQLPPSD